MFFNVVACGSPTKTFTAFRGASPGKDARRTLLVDSERPAQSKARSHLQEGEGWNLSFATDGEIHLMVETMESWIIADTAALANFYGSGFLPGALPDAENLESVGKTEIAKGFDNATRNSSMKKYHKIQHASELLKLIDPAPVQSRCPSARRFFEEVTKAITA